MMLSVRVCFTRAGRLPRFSSALRARSARPASGSSLRVSTSPPDDFGALNDLRQIKGIGPKTLEQLAQLNIQSVSDLLLHFPRSIVDRSRKVDLTDACLGEVVTVQGTVEKVKEGFRGAPSVVHCKDLQGTRFILTYFFGKSSASNFLWNNLKKVHYPGAQIVVSGRLTKSTFWNVYDFVNPDLAVDASSSSSLEKVLVVEPRYGLTEGLSSSKMRNLVQSALDLFQGAEHRQFFSNDWLPRSVRTHYGWPTMLEALVTAHSPESLASLEVTSAWRQRLAFDELVAMQVRQLVAQAKKDEELAERQRLLLGNSQAADSAYVVKGTGALSSILVSKLPFKLTNCQSVAVSEIWEQMGKPKRMVRCVQGDVGSGKTLVAVLAMLRAVEDGKQAALLAPTEILAKQHMLVISKYFEIIRCELSAIRANLGREGETLSRPEWPSVGLITGGVRGPARDALLSDLRDGRVDVLIGTHALLSESVSSSFRSLGLVCIDEEQRFGVNQRDALGDRSNVLYTTATPIPRSLMMVVQEEYEISTLNEKPPAKRPIQTILVGVSYVDRIIERVRANIPFGSKVFWVTPCLQPSQNLAGSSAMERFEQLSGIFPGKVALLHGKMSSEEKEHVMEQFSKRDGDISILVSTTVVEVGVDVPDASICVIDRAENFGLSQIHQIRGRVGRGEKPKREILKECFCVLLYHDVSGEDEDPLSPKAKLQILARSNDGFEIAESDLKLRGPGDIFGLRQHGEANYRVASLTDHAHLLGDAMTMAVQITDGQGEFIKGQPPLHLQTVFSMFLNNDRKREKLSILDTPIPSTADRPEKVKSSSPSSASAPSTASTNISAVKTSAGYLAMPVADLNNDEAVVIAIDLETTGLSAQYDEIIQIGAKVTGSSDQTFNRYVLPDTRELSPKIEKLTGITMSFLQEQGHSFVEAYADFKSWVAHVRASHPEKKIILAAHNGRAFDFKFIHHQVRRSDWLADASIDALIDTMELLRELRDSQRYNTGIKPGQSLKLGSVFSFVSGVEAVDLHNAMSDVLALDEILTGPRSAIIGDWRTLANERMFTTAEEVGAVAGRRRK